MTPSDIAKIANAKAPIVRVSKNYKPLIQSNIVNREISVGTLLDVHEKIRELGGSVSDGGELAGPWFIYKEKTLESAKDTITKEQIKVFIDAGVVNRSVLLQELIAVGQEFSGPSLAAGGELVGPWFVLREGENRFETLGDISVLTASR